MSSFGVSSLKKRNLLALTRSEPTTACFSLKQSNISDYNYDGELHRL